MSFVAELRVDEPNLSVFKTIPSGAEMSLSSSNGEAFHHIKLQKSGFFLEKRKVENSFWEGVAIDVSPNTAAITVWADPIGLVPVFYSVSPDGEIVVVTDDPKYLIDSVLKAVEPDVVGFWQALAFETPLRNRTILKNVRQLAGGEKMSITKNGEISISRYWKWDNKDSFYSSMEFDQCVDIACQLFDGNMSRFEDNKVGESERELLLPLSGGADSRLAAVLAARHYPKDGLQPVTYAYSKFSREVAIAKRISARLGLREPHYHQLTAQTYSDALRYMPRETGGLVSFANVHLLDFLRSNNVIGGIVSSGFSDALFGYEARSDRKLPYETWAHSEKVQKWRSFVQEFKVSSAIDEETMGDLEHLSRAWHESAITAFDEYLYIVERHVKFHLPLLHLWRRHAPVLTPFLSFDLIRLFFSMPSRFRIKKMLEHAVIQRLAPEVGSIESMSSLVLSGRSGSKADRLANRGINLANVAFRSIGFADLEIPSPRITEQLAKALHTTLKRDYAEAVSRLAELGLYSSQQTDKVRKPALRVGNRLGTQFTALNCSAVYSLKL